MLRACILAIGDEIVSGITTDTNSPHLADALRSIGIETVGGFSVDDDEDRIARALRRALDDAEIILTTGGLGPTVDDLTAAVVARVADREMRTDPGSLQRIEDRFSARSLPMPPNNAKQALIPAGAIIVPNPLGTAPGFICPVDHPQGERHIITLPGVPREMRRMVEETVIPWARARAGGRQLASRVFSTHGISESRLDELLTGVIHPSEGRLSFRAAFPRMQTRVAVEGGAGEDLESKLDAVEERIRARLGSAIYAVGDVGLEEVVVHLLGQKGLTLAVAESCTGGLIGHRLTDVPGSSAVFQLGVVAYANEAKMRQLGVRATTLEAHGAVSSETAAEMAEGVRRAGSADIGLATTGIAGPGGGTDEKPVGTVCVGVAWEGGVWSRRFQLGTRERDWVKRATAQLALDLVRRHASGESLDDR